MHILEHMQRHQLRLLSILFLMPASLGLVIQSTRTARAQTGVEVISTSSSGQIANSWSEWPSVSADGRFVAYVSQADNLVATDHNFAADIFVYDRLDSSIRRVSRSSTGVEADGWSFHPNISADGRFVAFTSVAQNLVPGDTNGLADVFLHDLLTGQTIRVSRGRMGEPANGWSDRPSLSADGRYMVFASSASNLVFGDTNSAVDVFTFDRLTGQIRRISVSSDGNEAAGPSGWEAVISADGRRIVFKSAAENLHRGDQNGNFDLFLHHRVTGVTRRIDSHNLGYSLHEQPWPALTADGKQVAYRAVYDDPSVGLQDVVLVQNTETDELLKIVKASSDVTLLQGLSADGRFLWVMARSSVSGLTTMRRYDLVAGSEEQIAGDVSELKLRIGTSAPFVSANGQIAAAGVYVDSAAPESRPQTALYVLGGQVQDLIRPFVAGKITDRLGTPVRGVVVEAAGHSKTRTGPDGVFYLGSLPKEPIRLQFEKNGFVFSPPELVLHADADLNDLQIYAEHERVLEEARVDIGMPYSFHRGCDNDLEGCGGPYHGFYAGYCTDLILDAYGAGLAFDIQFALERDALINPDHFYRWRNARNSHDMWRYFHYTDQMLDNEQPYLPGDILFFDWDADAIIDHVSILSEITASGRPQMMIDATGKIDYNPSGLTTELTWEPFHEQTVRGHARWRGSFGPSWNDTPDNLEMLHVAVDSADVSLRLIDEQGRQLSALDHPGEPHGSVALIPQGNFHSQPLGEVFALQSPLSNGQTYILEFRSQRAESFYLHVQTKVGPQVTQYEGSWRDPIPPGNPVRMGLVLYRQGERLMFHILEF